MPVPTSIPSWTHQLHAHAAFAAIWNLCGLPAMWVPTHHDAASGLPTGVQVVAPAWRDDLCLQVAAHLEQALPWRDGRPTIASCSPSGSG